MRILTAASLHDGLTAQMLKASELVPALLAALTTATDALAIPLVDLLHNLTLTRIRSEPEPEPEPESEPEPEPGPEP